MNSRQHRAAVQAKRGDIDLSRHKARGYLLDGLTDADREFMDADRERQKYDPAVAQQQDHALIQDQQQMLHIMRRSM